MAARGSDWRHSLFAVVRSIMPAGYPTVRPLQVLDFLNQANVDSRFNFTRSTIGQYIDASGIQRTASIDTPRPSYHPLTGAYQGLLMESASTNILPWSNDITASGWYYAPQNGAIGSGYIGVGGEATAYRIAEGSVPGNWILATSVAISGNSDYAMSAFLKSDGVNRGYLQLAGYDASGILKGNMVVYFDLQRETVLPEAYGTNIKSALMTKRRNGWFRIGGVGPMASGAVLGVLNLLLQRDDGSSFYQGNGNGLLTDGFQVEGGNSNAYISSFIPTSGSASTRATDTLQSASNQFSDWYVQSGATFYHEALVLNDDFYGSGRTVMQVINPTTQARSELRLDASSTGARFNGIVATGVGLDIAVGGSFRPGNGLNAWENPVSGNGTSRNVTTKVAYSFLP
jgi:hypothetical protein